MQRQHRHARRMRFLRTVEIVLCAGNRQGLYGTIRSS
jgi:hypothetical protein